VLRGIGQGVGDVELAPDVLDVERGEPGRQIGIGEEAADGRGAKLASDIYPAGGTKLAAYR
jgi:hypothetical protein